MKNRATIIPCQLNEAAWRVEAKPLFGLLRQSSFRNLLPKQTWVGEQLTYHVITMEAAQIWAGTIFHYYNHEPAVMHHAPSVLP
jgi:hypothetical protein